MLSHARAVELQREHDGGNRCNEEEKRIEEVLRAEMIVPFVSALPPCGRRWTHFVPM